VTSLRVLHGRRLTTGKLPWWIGVLASALLAGSATGLDLGTDRARYAPGETVRFTVSTTEDTTVRVTYRHGCDVLATTNVTARRGGGTSWAWTPPADDGRGYLVEAQVVRGTNLLGRGAIAVDVSRDWRRYPRYGYLADFGAVSPAEAGRVVARLNRHHINGIQFYDWHWKHHRLVPWEGEEIADSWQDVAGRPVRREAVQRYIQLAHQRGMIAAFYNLLYGAWDDAGKDGVSREWGLFQDAKAERQDLHDLPDSWASDIFLMNPADARWRAYLFRDAKRMLTKLPFDAWHVDQLGDRGRRFDAAGKPVDVAGNLRDFLETAKRELGVRLVMNAVSQYGQEAIAAAPVEFLYTEVWPGNDSTSYRDLQRIIEQNRQHGGGRLASVIAGYVNYRVDKQKRTFNAPGVLLADAVIFASGGAHVELGESLLSSEYFPVRMATTPALDAALVAYHDFLVAYQEWLRGPGRHPIALRVSSTAVHLTAHGEQGGVWTFGYTVGERTVVHFINLTGTAHTDWRDDFGTQSEPPLVERIALTFDMPAPKRAWVASPDRQHGIPEEIPVRREADGFAVTLPALKYWTMLVWE
jgi:dextranase